MKRGLDMYNANYYPFNYPRKNNLFSGVKNFNWSTFLDGTQKTLNIINQAIPIIYQIKPIYQNAKTAFKLVNAFKEESNKNKSKKENIRTNTITNNSPTYFL